MHNWLPIPGTPQADRLAELIATAREAMAAQTPEQQAVMWRKQRRGMILSEAGFGSDRDEAAYRTALETGNQQEIADLDAKANERIAHAAAFCDRIGC